MRSLRLTAAMALVALFVIVGGCAKHYGKDRLYEKDHPRKNQAVAVIQPTAGNSVRGVVTFTRTESGVRVQARVRGLKPGARHGFHLHRFGDARSPDGTSAGGHYDPEGTNHHDRPNADEPHHAGDLGNLTASDTGLATYDRVIENISVVGHDNPVVGRGVIVHAKPDDFGQPTGNAGARIGIGVIGTANPER